MLQPGATAQPQVIFVNQQVNDMAGEDEQRSRKAHLTLACIQTVIILIAGVMEIISISISKQGEDFFGTGLWFSFWIILPAILGFIAGCTLEIKCVKMSLMVMAILGACAAGHAIVFYSVRLHIYVNYAVYRFSNCESCVNYNRAKEAIGIIMALISLIVCIVQAACCCRDLCYCCRATQGSQLHSQAIMVPIGQTGALQGNVHGAVYEPVYQPPLACPSSQDQGEVYPVFVRN